MNDDLFAELLESAREGGAIMRGDKAPSRQFEVENPDKLQALVSRPDVIRGDPEDLVAVGWEDEVTLDPL